MCRLLCDFSKSKRLPHRVSEKERHRIFFLRDFFVCTTELIDLEAIEFSMEFSAFMIKSSLRLSYRLVRYVRVQ